MKNWKIVLGILVVFISGIVIGGVGTGIFIKHRVEQVLDGGPATARKFAVKRLTRVLDLSTKQRTEIEPIVHETQRQLFKLRKLNQPEVERIANDALRKMTPHLDKAQQDKLKSLYERAMKRFNVPESAYSGESL